MSWKPKFYIVYADSMIQQVAFPEGWAMCTANLPTLLRELLNISTIGSEIKLIWNLEHREIMLEKNGITNDQLDAYIKADCNMLSFTTKGTMRRVVKELKKMGCENFVCVDNYKDMILQQVFYQQNKYFY